MKLWQSLLLILALHVAFLVAVGLAETWALKKFGRYREGVDTSFDRSRHAAGRIWDASFAAQMLSITVTLIAIYVVSYA